MAAIEAFFFDQDGVIIDTEKDGHRIAFNETFKDFGYDVEWDVDYYHELLQIAGGKERMRHHLHEFGFGAEVKPDEEDELIQKLHKHKTEKFIALLEKGQLPLRTGVYRLMKEINSLGLVLAICTTSNQRSAKAVSSQMLKDIHFDFVLAGDVVSSKKPDPEIYELAFERAGLEPDQCIVIEDSHNGVLAAHQAGMHVVATTNFYTEREDLSLADIVVSSLGDPGGDLGCLISGGSGLEYDGVLHADQLIQYFSI